jgi:hypothetical protein
VPFAPGTTLIAIGTGDQLAELQGLLEVEGNGRSTS